MNYHQACLGKMKKGSNLWSADFWKKFSSVYLALGKITPKSQSPCFRFERFFPKRPPHARKKICVSIRFGDAMTGRVREPASVLVLPLPPHVVDVIP